MKPRKRNVTAPFTARRKRDSIERKFEVGFPIWVDFDQTGALVEFEVDNDPWIVDREELFRSIRISD
jgi:hypothetical protein